MSLSFAVLGLLAQEPMTGYDLKHRWFDQSLRYFWPADQAQIYRTLDGLQRQGWVTVRIEPGSERPNRKVYAPTVEGLEALRGWLTTPQPLPTVRDPLLVQLFCGAELTDEELRLLLGEQREVHQSRLSEYQAIQTWLRALPESRRQRLWLLTVDNGVQRERAYLDWLHMAATELDVEIGDTPGPDRT